MRRLPNKVLSLTLPWSLIAVAWSVAMPGLAQPEAVEAAESHQNLHMEVSVLARRWDPVLGQPVSDVIEGRMQRVRRELTLNA